MFLKQPLIAAIHIENIKNQKEVDEDESAKSTLAGVSRLPRGRSALAGGCDDVGPSTTATNHSDAAATVSSSGIDRAKRRRPRHVPVERDADHEANETRRRAAEDSGQGRGHGGGHPNEDPEHEANESAEREAQEERGSPRQQHNRSVDRQSWSRQPPECLPGAVSYKRRFQLCR